MIRVCSLIAPGTHRPAPGTIRAAQGAKSGAESGRKRKGKVSRLPQKCSTIVRYGPNGDGGSDGDRGIKIDICMHISEAIYFPLNRAKKK